MKLEPLYLRRTNVQIFSGKTRDTRFSESSRLVTVEDLDPLNSRSGNPVKDILNSVGSVRL